MKSQNRPGVIVFVPTHAIRPGHFGCACPYPECAKWSVIDPSTRTLAQPSGCAHAFDSETFSSGLDYIMYTHDPRGINPTPGTESVPGHLSK
jgi:hypothetical protein